MSESTYSSDEAVSISSLLIGCRCPRQYYYAKNNPFTESEKYTICRQISRSLNGLFDEESLWDEISLIDPSISPDMRDFFSICLSKNRKTPLPSWTDTDISVHSSKYGIYGLIDKYHAEKKYISIVRNSKAPTIGCWPLDRIRIVCYLLCMKESKGIDLTGGFIEYIPDGVIRFCEPQPRDRRMFLQGLKNVKDVEKGMYPKKPIQAPCKNCKYQDRCLQPTARTLSEIFFKKRE